MRVGGETEKGRRKEGMKGENGSLRLLSIGHLFSLSASTLLSIILAPLQRWELQTTDFYQQHAVEGCVQTQRGRRIQRSQI